MNDEVLVRVEGMSKFFPINRGLFRRHTGDVKAVDEITFDIRQGETLGLVGESGCGKSTTGRAILQVYRPTAGKVYFKGTDLTALEGEDLRRVRKGMQIVFQDPYASLNPRMNVGQIVGEPLRVHRFGTLAERRTRIEELLEGVGLSARMAARYPHEFSGGQRQRIGIARALALNPEFVVCDEPISALDVSIQAQVVNLFEELQERFNLTYLFIAHDLSMVRHISDRTAVMYLGKMAELTTRDELYSNPLHPYTQALLSAVPVPHPEKERGRKRVTLSGDVPSPANPPSGCRFHTRCPIAKDICGAEVPEWREKDPEHWVACHFA